MVDTDRGEMDTSSSTSRIASSSSTNECSECAVTKVSCVTSLRASSSISGNSSPGDTLLLAPAAPPAPSRLQPSSSTDSSAYPSSSLSNSYSASGHRAGASRRTAGSVSASSPACRFSAWVRGEAGEKVEKCADNLRTSLGRRRSEPPRFPSSDEGKKSIRWARSRHVMYGMRYSCRFTLARRTCTSATERGRGSVEKAESSSAKLLTANLTPVLSCNRSKRASLEILERRSKAYECSPSPREKAYRPNLRMRPTRNSKRQKEADRTDAPKMRLNTSTATRAYWSACGDWTARSCARR
mmetsp:Transcript_12094/g.38396  ORF Transcript_12094/g.38396 Transcript_12094/m.38396 type:complete len:298 (-) Transcript_12094:521-1414(-)